MVFSGDAGPIPMQSATHVHRTRPSHRILSTYCTSYHGWQNGHALAKASPPAESYPQRITSRITCTFVGSSLLAPYTVDAAAVMQGKTMSSERQAPKKGGISPSLVVRLRAWEQNACKEAAASLRTVVISTLRLSLKTRETYY